MRKSIVLLALVLLSAAVLGSLLRFGAPPPTAGPTADERTSVARAADLLDPPGDDGTRGTRQLSSSADPNDPSRSAVAEGVLAGTLTDRAAEPLAGMRLWAFPAQWIDDARPSLMRWKAEVEAEEAAASAAEAMETEPARTARESPALFANASTGLAGEFRFENLRSGPYFIAAASDLDLARTTLLRRVFSTGDLAIRLVLTPYWLQVRAAGMDEEERAQGIIYCREALSEPGRVDEPVWEVEATPDQALFPVEVGRTYVYGWLSDHRPPSEARVTITAAEPTTVRVLELGAPVEKGLVIVRVAKPDGSPWTAGCNLRALAQSSGRELARVGGQAPLHAYLPPGNHRLFVDVGDSARVTNEDGEGGEARYGIAEVACEIRPGGTTEVNVRLWEAGILDLALFGELELSEGEARALAAACAVGTRKRPTSRGQESDEVDWLVILDGGARQRRPLQPAMQYDARRRKEPSTSPVERGPNGQFHTVGDVTLRIRTAVEPGDYELRVRLPGFESIERRVQIRAGEEEVASLALTRTKKPR